MSLHSFISGIGKKSFLDPDIKDFNNTDERKRTEELNVSEISQFQLILPYFLDFLFGGGSSVWPFAFIPIDPSDQGGLDPFVRLFKLKFHDFVVPQASESCHLDNTLKMQVGESVFCFLI